MVLMVLLSRVTTSSLPTLTYGGPLLLAAGCWRGWLCATEALGELTCCEQDQRAFSFSHLCLYAACYHALATATLGRCPTLGVGRDRYLDNLTHHL